MDIVDRLTAEADLLAKLECKMHPTPQEELVIAAAVEIERLRAALQKIERRANAKPLLQARHEIVIMARQARRLPTGSRNLLGEE